MLTAERLREVLDYNPETGEFRWRAGRYRVKAGQIAGTVMKIGYRSICVDQKPCYAHRLAWLYTHGVWPENHIDHINGDKLDNRIANLRDVTRSHNLSNRTRAEKRNKSGHRGVFWDEWAGKWRVRLEFGGKVHEGGRFDSKDDAVAAHEKLAAEVWGDFKVGKPKQDQTCSV